MQEVEKFVELARKKFDSQPFIEDYLNKKLKYKELVGTYLYNQWVYTCQIEGLCKDAGLLEDIKEICNYLKSVKTSQKCHQKFSSKYLIQDRRYPYICPISLRK